MEKVQVGKVKHFFRKINVAVIELSDSLKVGDTIEVGKDEENAFQQDVKSMEIDKKPVETAKNEVIGMVMEHPVKEGAVVSKIKD